jgi:hypothetical protein
VQAVGGELGVARTVEMLRDELKTCMQLGGTQHVGQIDRTFIVRHGVAEDEVSPFLACIGSPCLRHCVHGVSIGPSREASCAGQLWTMAPTRTRRRRPRHTAAAR